MAGKCEFAIKVEGYSGVTNNKPFQGLNPGRVKSRKGSPSGKCFQFKFFSIKNSIRIMAYPIAKIKIGRVIALNIGQAIPGLHLKILCHHRQK